MTICGGPPDKKNESIKTGATNDNVAAVALIPTQRGETALARSALARRPSASAAHWRVAAATSFPSATATFPVYSAPIPIAADTAYDFRFVFQVGMS